RSCHSRLTPTVATRSFKSIPMSRLGDGSCGDAFLDVGFSRRGSYSAVTTRTGGVCIPPRRAQPAPAQTARQGFPDRPSGFSRPPVRVLRCPKHVPNAAEIGRKIEFLTVDAGFGPS